MADRGGRLEGVGQSKQAIETSPRCNPGSPGASQVQPREAIETSPRCKLVVRATGARLGKVPGSSLVVSKEEPTMVFFVIFFVKKVHVREALGKKKR